MSNRPNYVKIRTNILIDPSKHFIYKDGKLNWNNDYLEEFYNADAKFREPILPFINDAIGLYNWGVRFQPFYTGEYEAYIYCDNEVDFNIIVSIITDRLNEPIRLFKRNGTVDDYIANR